MQKAGWRPHFPASSPWAHRFNAGGLTVLQMWQNDVCMGHDRWYLCRRCFALDVRWGLTYRSIYVATISCPTWEGKHNSTVRNWHFCPPSFSHTYQMHVQDSTQLQKAAWKTTSFSKTVIFKVFCNDVMYIKLLMWCLKRFYTLESS